MALHTYEDFTKKLGSSGLQGQFSAEDLALAQRDPDRGMTILNAKIGWNNSKDPVQQAYYHSMSEQARKEGGNYSGGGNGADYLYLGDASAGAQNKLNELGNYGSFQYESPYAQQLDSALKGLQNTGSFQWAGTAPTYTNSYQNLQNDLLNKLGQQGSFSYDKTAPSYQNQYAEMQKDLLDQIVNRPEFSWDKNSDPSYSAYRKEYLREGDRASANALAQASAASAGRPSSYAATAAAQAGDYYAGKLADKIPELYENAYQHYLNEYSMKRQDLSNVNTQEQLDYSKYLDQLGQFNTDRNFALQSYNANRDSILDQFNAANSLADREFNLYQTNLGQYNTDRNFALSQWDANRGAALDYLNAVMGLDNQKFNQGLSTWQNNLDLLGTQLGAYQGQEQTDYERRMEELNRVLQQEQQDYERAWNEDERDYNRLWNQTQWDYSKQQDSQKLLQNQVDAMLQAGAGAPADMVSGSGYDPRYAQALEAYYKQQAAAAAAKSSGGSSGSRRSGSGSSGSSGGSDESGSSGVSGAKFQAITRSLGEQLANDRKANALAYLRAQWDSLSDAQKAQMQSTLAKYDLAYNP